MLALVFVLKGIVISVKEGDHHNGDKAQVDDGIEYVVD